MLCALCALCAVASECTAPTEGEWDELISASKESSIAWLEMKFNKIEQIPDSIAQLDQLSELDLTCKCAVDYSMCPL
jgi:hypothetical protein